MAVFDGVDLDGLEEVVLGAVEDDGCGGAEVGGELGEWHGGAVDAAVVAREEEVHVGAIGDEGLVDWPGVAVGDGTGEEGVGLRPAVGVDGVYAGAVGEGSCAPLIR